MLICSVQKGLDFLEKQQFEFSRAFLSSLMWLSALKRVKPKEMEQTKKYRGSLTKLVWHLFWNLSHLT